MDRHFHAILRDPVEQAIVIRHRDDCLAAVGQMVGDKTKITGRRVDVLERPVHPNDVEALRGRHVIDAAIRRDAAVDQHLPRGIVDLDAAHRRHAPVMLQRSAMTPEMR